MSEAAKKYASALVELSQRVLTGAQALAVELERPPLPEPAFGFPEPSPAPQAPAFDRVALFDGLRAIYGPFDGNEVAAIDRAIDRALGLVAPEPQIGITAEAFRAAALELDPDPVHGMAAIRAVDEVEAAGGGFDRARSDILGLDGPGGFIDGENLPKILFEAHIFSAETGHKFDKSHPNLSSRQWNRALYVGGQGEYARLHKAMQLDRPAALKAASWGRYQILGRNFEACGFSDVGAFAEAMKESEQRQLDAFVAFIKANGLADEFRAIGPSPASCAPFARGYNGPGFAANNYHGKIAQAFTRWNAKLRS